MVGDIYYIEEWREFILHTNRGRHITRTPSGAERTGICSEHVIIILLGPFSLHSYEDVSPKPREV